MTNTPKAAKHAKILTKHNDTRIDNYFWLNDRENHEVINYLHEENEYTAAALVDVAELKETLYNEITSRIPQKDESVPYFLRGYYYYHRYIEGGEYPIYCRKKAALTNTEEILLDVNQLANGQAYCHVEGMDISPDNRFLAYGVDNVSRRLYTLFVKDLHTGKNLIEEITNTDGNVAWANDNETFFYTVKDTETLRESYIYKHKLYDNTENDIQIFVEEDDTFTCDVSRSKSGEYIFIHSTSTVSDEFRFLNTNEPSGEFKIVFPRKRNHEYTVEHFGDYFYIRTNSNAQNFKLIKVPTTNLAVENWKEVVSHQKDFYLDDFEIFEKHIVIGGRENATYQLLILDINTYSIKKIAFDEDVYEVEMAANVEIKTNILRYTYSSLTTPNTYFDYNMDTNARIMLKQQRVMGNFNSSNYQSKRLWAIATDGNKIPISLVSKKGIELNGANPLLLYGYGSYGLSIDAYFNSARLSLINRGFIFAIAHIRGGQEMGRQWYENGKLKNKKKTFTDFIACAEHLIDLKYTSPNKLFAIGGSAGGLLMGAVVNMRPELFKGVIAAVPFVDIMTTMLDEDIPLTTGEYDEWGNPNIPEDYDYMRSYSPYDNVEPKEYPNLLVTTGLHDSQVQYWEPAKWVAKLRELKTDNNLLLLHTNMAAGHGGASGRFERHRETALEYAFLLKFIS